MTIKQVKLAVVTVFTAALVMPIVGSAQEAGPPKWIQARIVHLQADGSAKWVELQKQLVAAERDENARRDVWEVVRGELDTYHIVSFHQDLAGFDEQGGGAPLGDAQAAWIAAITPTIASRTQTMLRYHLDMSIPFAEDAKRNLMVLRYHTIVPGQGNAFQRWVKEKLKPALVKGGVTGLNYSHVAYGGDTGMWVSASALENWARLDGPGPLAGLSDEENRALFASFGDMVAGTEIRLLRYREDLSY